jgi:hypothetical protein
MSNMIRAGLAALAVSGLVLSAGTALAGGPDDKSASAEVKGAGPAALKAAKRAAIAEWKQEVAEDGNSPVWKTATEKKVKCETDDGETECKVEARPLH